MRNAIFFAFCLLFHGLFWQQELGINAVIFAFLLQLFAKWDTGFTFHGPVEFLYLFGFLASSFGLIYYHSIIAHIALVLVNLVYLSYHYGPKYSPLEHAFNAALRAFQFRQALLAEPVMYSKVTRQKVWSYLSISLLPIILFGVFTALFRAGNPVFKEWSQGFIDALVNMLPDYDLAWLFFMILGVLIIKIPLLKKKVFYWLLPESNFVIRKLKKSYSYFKPLALKREYRMAWMIFASLNILILIVNIIDVNSFWFGFNMPAHFSLKEFLHEGVWALFVSLLLAMVLSFYFFRANLNFYPRNKIFLGLAKLWVLQNGVLTISVALRSYYYIDFHGLANGRIIVLAMLSLVLVALILLFIKLQSARNAAFTIRWMGLYLGLLLSVCSLINWDMITLRYNLEHGRINEIDVDNYLYLNPRTYPYLLENLDRVALQIEAHNTNAERWISTQSMAEFEANLEKRMTRFLENEAKQTWQSWNFADQKTRAQLMEYQKRD